MFALPADVHLFLLQNQHHQIDSLISLSKYIDSLRKLQALAAGVKGQKAFLATDDIEAEMVIKRAFPEGPVPSLLMLVFTVLWVERHMRACSLQQASGYRADLTAGDTSVITYCKIGFIQR